VEDGGLRDLGFGTFMILGSGWARDSLHFGNELDSRQMLCRKARLWSSRSDFPDLHPGVHQRRKARGETNHLPTPFQLQPRAGGKIEQKRRESSSVLVNYPSFPSRWGGASFCGGISSSLTREPSMATINNAFGINCSSASEFL
jgi:hypothetical protein